MHRLLACFMVCVVCHVAIAHPPDPIADARRLMNEKKYEQASAAIDAYLQTNRFDGRAWSALAMSLHYENKLQRSIAAGQRAIELGYNVGNEMYNIACAYALMKQPDEAIGWIER